MSFSVVHVCEYMISLVRGQMGTAVCLYVHESTGKELHSREHTCPFQLFKKVTHFHILVQDMLFIVLGSRLPVRA